MFEMRTTNKNSFDMVYKASQGETSRNCLRKWQENIFVNPNQNVTTLNMIKCSVLIIFFSYNIILIVLFHCSILKNINTYLQ